VSRRHLKIALIGTRGVPANYGGFETCVEEVGKRLADKGHEITVYCRKSYYDKGQDYYLCMKRVCLPNLKNKSLDTMSHSFLSAWHALFQNFDVYMVFNAANSPFVSPLKIFGKTLAINTDGLEWKRSKWGFGGRSFYKISEKIACLIANRIVTDSKGMKNYYQKRYNAVSTEIAYGAPIQSCEHPDKLRDMGLEPGKYFLQITRFEPENFPLLTVKAFKKLNTDKKLILVGGNPYPNDYTKAIEEEASDNVLLPGFIYELEILREIWCNCYAYIHGNSVGGTNPALLQTMASGCFTISINIQFNKDVLADCGIYYENHEDSLAEKMKWALGNEDKLDAYGRKAQQRILEKYNWDKVADQYEELFYELADGKYPWKISSHFFRTKGQFNDVP
jgi:glycosyltransferase involved in cell wall biosynthesis